MPSTWNMKLLKNRLIDHTISAYMSAPAHEYVSLMMASMRLMCRRLARMTAKATMPSRHSASSVGVAMRYQSRTTSRYALNSCERSTVASLLSLTKSDIVNGE